MELHFEDQEEHTEYADDYEQRRQMRRERQQRIRKQRMRRRCLYLGVAGVFFILLISVLIWAIKSGSGKNSSQAQKDQAVEQKNQPQPAKQHEEAEDESEVEKRIPVYRFASTPDTAVIDLAEVISTHAVLINESTDTIIAAKGMDERIFPASMTKVLTVLVAAEQMEKEQLDDTFAITLDITDYAFANECSIVGFANGEEVTVRDLFYGTILPSGGDAAVALAVYTAGSQEAFVALMNAKLEELGIAGSAHFTNCVGLYDENHYCTVYDMAVIMKAAIQNELCREILSAHTYTTTPTAQHPQGITISNWFLRRIEDKDTRGIVQYAKTGYIAESQNCAVSYGTFAGQTPYICVTTGSTSSWRCIYDHVELYTRYIPAQ